MQLFACIVVQYNQKRKGALNMNYIVFDSYTGEVDCVNAAELKAIEQTSEPGRYSYFQEPDFDWLDEMEEHFK